MGYFKHNNLTDFEQIENEACKRASASLMANKFLSAAEMCRFWDSAAEDLGHPEFVGRLGQVDYKRGILFDTPDYTGIELF